MKLVHGSAMKNSTILFSIQNITSSNAKKYITLIKRVVFLSFCVSPVMRILAIMTYNSPMMLICDFKHLVSGIEGRIPTQRKQRLHQMKVPQARLTLLSTSTHNPL